MLARTWGTTIPRRPVNTPAQARLASGQQVARAALVAGLAVAVALSASHVLVRVADLFPTTLPPNPYFVPQHGLLLYLVAPAIVVACVVMFITPGLLLVLAIGGDERAGSFLIKSFGAAFLLRWLAHGAWLTVFDSISFTAFAVVELLLDIPLAVLAIWRASNGTVRWPFSTALDRRRLMIALVMPAVIAALLTPMMFWQDLHGDGLEALESGVSLTWHFLPRSINPLGVGHLGAGLIAMAVPVHWFVALIGPIEAAARLPFALFMPILFTVLVEVIEWNAPRPLRVAEELVLLLALVTFSLALGFNAGYDAYWADWASPTMQETLTILFLAATILFVWQERRWWLMLFSVLGFMARPQELIVLAALAFGIAVGGGDRKRVKLQYIAWAAAACVLILVLHDVVWVPNAVGLRESSPPFFARWRYLTFTDLRRLLYVAVPTGLLPFLSQGLWPKMDREARQVALVSVLLFVMFYIWAFVTLQHFAAAMVLPLIVFWRIALRADARWVTPAAAVATAVCFWLSIPRRFELPRAARGFGCRTFFQGADLNDGWQTRRATLREARVLRVLFQSGVKGPERRPLIHQGAIVYYASRCAPPADSAQYLALRLFAAAPVGAVQVGGDSVRRVFVRDTLRWRAEMSHLPPTDWRSSLYNIPRVTQDSPTGLDQRTYQLDVGRIPLIRRLVMH